MSTLDATVSLLEQLSDNELSAIQTIAKAFISKGNNSSTVFKPQDEAELLKRIDAAIASAKKGDTVEATASVEMLRSEFGL